MRLISLLAILLLSGKSNCFAENRPISSGSNFFANYGIYLKVAKPLYIDVSKHYTSYGILGPESFINYVTLTVLDNNGDTTIADKIVVGINDHQAQVLNNMQTLEIYVEIAQTMGDYPEFDARVYRFIAVTDRNQFLKHTPINDIYWISDDPGILPFELKIKSKPVSVSITSFAQITINDSIEKDTIITYEVLEVADSLSATIFGKEIKVLKNNQNFDSDLPYCRITVNRSGLRTDNGLSKEMIYEVISVVPVKE